uniref:Retrovirus-related Pol polyprotein from transposon TNT 1-94 n=1 Tax=Tanacetum cinerariifolium TaxID=118510 RepID=A0A6L2MWA3_TANCI|nr:retrovirus-related Pol polyprotein from transposon TNT 1-94 [Tanacetum cinerariifolium]
MFDSRCSRHMTGNKTLLTDYQDIDGGFVAFGGSTKGGKITVLLRVPRQNNMYGFDLQNVVPSGDLTCLFAKATIDESNLWHRRLGHAEAVNIACYVLNRVLVTKPHNKKPYELIIGRPPSISFMRPFGCLVTILITLDPLGKFDGKAKKGFLVGYSVTSKAFRVFNTQTKKVKENLDVNFLENKPNVTGQGPNWLFDIGSLANSMNYQPVTAGNQANKNASHQEVNGDTGLKKNVDVRHTEQEKVSTQQYIVSPLWSSIYLSYKSSDDKAGDNTADDATGKEKHTINTASASRTFIPPHDPLMPELEDTTEIQTTGIFGNAYDEDDLETNNHSYADESVGAEADFNNMEPSTVVSPIPTTRVHSNYTKA